MESFDNLILKYIDKYKKTSKPIDVNFKKLIPNLSNPDRATHLIHTYPAKLLMHIPHFFLNNNVLSADGDKVLDPFCGSGTVLLESIIANRNPIGADANPLARLLAQTKVKLYDTNTLKKHSQILLGSIDKRRTNNRPTTINVDYWFLPKVTKQLSAISLAIRQIEDNSLRDFYKVCFSNLIKKVSLADPRISVPVRLDPSKYPPGHLLRAKSKTFLSNLEDIDVVKKYSEIIQQNIKRFEKLNDLVREDYNLKIANDARDLKIGAKKVPSNSVQLCISSPPYAGAQKYVRSSSLSLGWLDLINEGDSLKTLDAQSIGRENFLAEEYKEFIQTGIKKADIQLKNIYKTYPKRAHIAAKYLIEMQSSLMEVNRVLKPGGYLVLIAANNRVCGNEFKTQEHLCSIIESMGLKVVFKLIDDIKSYGLMTKRNKTADVITREHIIVFQKI